jgi:hypothetical protein
MHRLQWDYSFPRSPHREKKRDISTQNLPTNSLRVYLKTVNYLLQDVAEISIPNFGWIFSKNPTNNVIQIEVIVGHLTPIYCSFIPNKS